MERNLPAKSRLQFSNVLQLSTEHFTSALSNFDHSPPEWICRHGVSSIRLRRMVELPKLL